MCCSLISTVFCAQPLADSSKKMIGTPNFNRLIRVKGVNISTDALILFDNYTNDNESNITINYTIVKDYKEKIALIISHPKFILGLL